MRELHSAGTPERVVELFLGQLTSRIGAVAYVELVVDPTPVTHLHPTASTEEGTTSSTLPEPKVKRGEYRISRLRTHSGEELVSLHTGQLATPFCSTGLPLRSGGFFGDIVTGPAHIRRVGELSVPDDEDFKVHIEVYRSMLAIPIFTAGHPEWMVLLHTEAAGFDEVPLEEVMLRANLICGMLNAMRVSRELAETQERLSDEMERIADIQKALQPSERPEVPGLDIAFSVTSYDRAGGDLIDFVWANDNMWVFIVADASGHGPSAAVVAAMLTAILHAFPGERNAQKSPSLAPLVNRPVSEVLRFANMHLCAKQIEHSFVTAFMGAFNPSTKVLDFSRAGHPLPVLLRRGEKPLEVIDAGGLPLGVLADAEFEDGRLQLQSGDLLVVYSDGINEAQCPTGEQFGTERIAEAIIPATSAQHAIELITSAVEEFAQGFPPGDDRTILAVRVL